MAICTVLNCENESRGGRFTTHEKVFMETAPCPEHLEKLQNGEQWNYSEDRNKREILMGSDLPPMLENFKIQRRVGSGVTMIFNVAGEEPRSVWVSKEQAQQMGSFLVESD